MVSKHTTGRLALVALLLLASIMFASHAHAFKLPKYDGMVTDLTNTLSSKDRAALEQKLETYRDSTTNEIAVLIIPTLDGVPKEDYGHDVFNAWGVGKKGKDNGVLFLIAMEEHETRIDVGYGLEGRLTDLLTSKLQDRNNSIMSQKFRDGDFAGGINTVIDGVIAIIGGDENPPQAEPVSTSGIGKLILIIIFIIVLFFVIAAMSGGIDIDDFGGGGFIGGGGGDSGGGGFSFGGGSCGGGGGGGGW